nr:MAG TPA: hypothetical protein [Microviridae sp.]
MSPTAPDSSGETTKAAALDARKKHYRLPPDFL